MNTLLIRTRDGDTRREELDPDVDLITIGRSARNDITIVDLTVSRTHAHLVKSVDGYELVDQNSRHGIIVNGQKITSPTKVGPGDHMLLGAVEIEVLADVRLTDGDFEMSAIETRIIPHDQTPRLNPMISPESLKLDPETRIDFQGLLQLIDEVNEGTIRSLDEVGMRIVNHCLEIIPISDRACLVAVEDGVLVPRAVRYRRGTDTASTAISRTIVRRALDTRDAVLTTNAQEDPRFSTSESAIRFGICSVMCVPLVANDELIGALYVDTVTPARRFRESELRIFAAVGNVSATYIAQQRLLAVRIQQQALEEQLRRAAEVQQKLLSVSMPNIPGYEFYMDNLPCLQVGGDYVDVLSCRGKVLLALGDVSGKGIDAALLMATLQAGIHAHTGAAADVLEIAQQVNTFLHQRTMDEKFASLFLACLDPKTGRLTYVNAGHFPPVVVRKGKDEPERLDPTGMIVGLFADAQLSAAETTIEPGDLLAVYTDGFFEQQNETDDDFGEERLARYVTSHAGHELEALADLVEAEVMQFAGNEPQQDDMTQLLLRRLSDA